MILLFTGLALGATPDQPCEDVFVKGWQADGTNIAADTTKTAALCLDMCEKYPLCRIGVYDARSKLCSLKSDVLTLSRKIDFVLVARSYKDFKRRPNEAISSETASLSGHHFVASEETCVNLCKAHPLCDLANYMDGDFPDVIYKNSCLLRQQGPKVRTISQYANYVSYVA